MAIVFALCAALANALTSIFQRLAARDAPVEDSFHLRLMTYLVRRPVWLAGMATLIAGFVLQAIALRYGRLATVQPLLATEIVFTLLVMWAWFRVPLGAAEWCSGIAIATGLGVFLGVAQPAGADVIPGVDTWVPASIAGVLTVAATAAFGLLALHGTATKAALFGSSAAVAFAFAAAVMKESATVVTRSGWPHLFQTWLPYSMAGVGMAGLFLAQNSFHAGPLSASQSALIIVDPLASILIGVSVFHEKIQAAGWQVSTEALALSVMVIGVIFLSRSDVLTRRHTDPMGEAPDHGHLLHAGHRAPRGPLPPSAHPEASPL